MRFQLDFPFLHFLETRMMASWVALALMAFSVLPIQPALGVPGSGIEGDVGLASHELSIREDPDRPSLDGHFPNVRFPDRIFPNNAPIPNRPTPERPILKAPMPKRPTTDTPTPDRRVPRPIPKVIQSTCTYTLEHGEKRECGDLPRDHYCHTGYLTVKLHLSPSEGWKGSTTFVQMKKILEQFCYLVSLDDDTKLFQSNYVPMLRRHFVQFHILSEIDCVLDALQCAAGLDAIAPRTCQG